jgi:transposase
LDYQYKEHISDFRQWIEKKNPYESVLYKQNMGEYLSIDETTLSQGELYTIVTNKEGKGKKGSLVAMICGTKADEVIFLLSKLPRSLRLKVKEITLDLSPTMQRICKSCFPNAELVSDRFHVQRLMNEAISDMRIDYRWEAIELENKEIAFAKELGEKYNPFTFKNGDTRRQLLARSRHIVMKHFSKWTDSQCIRAEILFREYPALEEAYQISMELTQIYNTTKSKGVGLTKLAHWYNKVERLNLKFFKSVITTMQNNYDTITNYFIRRATNASAESFNAKIKAFRSQFRGVRDIPFFIFRIEKLFA